MFICAIISAENINTAANLQLLGWHIWHQERCLMEITVFAVIYAPSEDKGRLDTL